MAYYFRFTSKYKFSSYLWTLSDVYALTIMACFRFSKLFLNFCSPKAYLVESHFPSFATLLARK